MLKWFLRGGIFILLAFASIGWGESLQTANTGPPEAVSPLISPQEKTLFDRAKAASAAEKFDAAQATLEQFILKFPDSGLLPDVYLDLAGVYLKRGETRRAIEAFKTILDRYPSHPRAGDARFQLSDLHLNLGDLREAIDLWADLPNEEATKISVYERAAQGYLSRNEPLEALQLLMRKRELVVDPEMSGTVRESIVSVVKDKLQEKDLQTVAKQYGAVFPADEALIRLMTLYDGRFDYFREEKEVKRFLTVFPNHAYSTEAKRLSGQIKEKIKGNRYLIAVILPLSGKLASFGNSALNAIQLAVQQFKESLPGASVGLVVKDIEEERSRLSETLPAWLDEYRPIAVVGPLLSKEVDRVSPIAEKADLVLITPGATSARLASLGKAVFRNVLTARFQCRAIAEHAVTRLNLKRFAILYPKDHFGTEWVQCFTQEITGLGGEVVHVESYPVGETDFTASIRRLKEADLKKGGVAEFEQQGRKKKEISYTPTFDALFLPGDADEVGLIIPQLVFHNIKEIPLLGTNGWNTPEFLKLVGPYAEGAVFVDGFFAGSSDPMIRKFVTQYRAKYQQEPDLLAAQAFDSARWVLAALEKGASTGREVKGAVAKTRDFPGVSGGIIEVREGEAVKKPFFIQVQKGKLVQVN